MIAYTIVSALVITALACILAYFVFKYASCRTRSERIEFVKTFKRGKFAIVYIASFPIFMLSELFAGKAVILAIFTSIYKSVYLVVLKFDIPSNLMEANPLYYAAVVICFTMVALNAMLLMMSFLDQIIWDGFFLYRFNVSKNVDRLIVLGNTPEGEMIYNSCKDKKVLAGVIKKEEAEKLYIKNIKYKACSSTDRLFEYVVKEINKLVKKYKGSLHKVNVIANHKDEQTKLDWCKRFCDFIATLPEESLANVDIYVFGEQEYEEIYYKYEEQARGTLHYVNIYKLVAIDFVDRYPLTAFMDDKQIDYESFTLKSGVDINVAMLGFGRTNQQVFLTQIANNQFVSKETIVNEKGKKVEKLESKDVKYSIFEMKGIVKSRNLNHRYFRYRYDFFNKEAKKDDPLNVLKLTPKVDVNEYLPLPSFPAEGKEYDYEIADTGFYDNLRKSLSEKKESLNYVIISIGNDYLGIDCANKITSKIKEWGLENTYIFVRINDAKLFKNASTFIDTNICHPFGCLKDVAYNYYHIINEKYEYMGILRSYAYNIEKELKHNVIEKDELKEYRKSWYTKLSPIDRESNIYACLSLRHKLNMMGLDFVKADSKVKYLSNEEYMNIYAKDDKPEAVYFKDNDLKAFKYNLNFKDSPRKNLAFLEHERWNAFMISKGFVPATKEEIASEIINGKRTNGKNYLMRRHGCLTSFEGLEEYRKIVAKATNRSEEECDVIKYDYQTLDGAWWLLRLANYMIIDLGKRKDNID